MCICVCVFVCDKSALTQDQAWEGGQYGGLSNNSLHGPNQSSSLYRLLPFCPHVSHSAPSPPPSQPFHGLTIRGRYPQAASSSGQHICSGKLHFMTYRECIMSPECSFQQNNMLLGLGCPSRFQDKFTVFIMKSSIYCGTHMQDL